MWPPAADFRAWERTGSYDPAMKPLVIVNSGGGGQAAVVFDACLAAGRPVAGWIRADEAANAPDRGLRLIGGLDTLRDDGLLSTHDVIVGGGMPAFRRSLSLEILASGATLATVRHPSATVSRLAEIGDGSFVAAGAVVGVHATLGRACMVNAGATIDHDCILADGASLSPGVHLAGFVHCGQDAFIGVGASIVPGVKIGARATVGAGAVVIRDVPVNATVVGNPAKPITR